MCHLALQAPVALELISVSEIVLGVGKKASRKGSACYAVYRRNQIRIKLPWWGYLVSRFGLPSLTGTASNWGQALLGSATTRFGKGQEGSQGQGPETFIPSTQPESFRRPVAARKAGRSWPEGMVSRRFPSCSRRS